LYPSSQELKSEKVTHLPILSVKRALRTFPSEQARQSDVA
jgi:hypothetical protein